MEERVYLYCPVHSIASMIHHERPLKKNTRTTCTMPRSYSGWGIGSTPSLKHFIRGILDQDIVTLLTSKAKNWTTVSLYIRWRQSKVKCKVGRLFWYIYIYIISSGIKMPTLAIAIDFHSTSEKGGHKQGGCLWSIPAFSYSPEQCSKPGNVMPFYILTLATITCIIVITS